MRLLKNLLLISIIFYIIFHFWIFIKMKMYGTTFPNDADTVIALIMTSSIYMNIRLIILKKENKV